MELFLVNRTRDAFIARRTENAPKNNGAYKKGRERRYIPAEWREQFNKSDMAEWEKWVRYDAVMIPTKEVLDTVDPGEVLPMIKMRTDKNEATRGGKGFDEHPPLANTRNLLPCYKDKQYLAGELKTNVPTLTDAVTAISLKETAIHDDWDLQQGDVDSAFLNGRYLRPDRRIFFRAPQGGLPALPEHGWPFIPQGTILQAKKGVYGTNDAPLLWYEEHRDAILSIKGSTRSKLCRALFIFCNEEGTVIGLAGTHGDDDLIAGPPESFKNQVAKLRNMHCYGRWHYIEKGFHH